MEIELKNIVVIGHIDSLDDSEARLLQQRALVGGHRLVLVVVEQVKKQ